MLETTPSLRIASPSPNAPRSSGIGLSAATLRPGLNAASGTTPHNRSATVKGARNLLRVKLKLTLNLRGIKSSVRQVFRYGDLRLTERPFPSPIRTYEVDDQAEY